MVPNHRQRRALGREGYALAACAVVVMIGLAAGAAASGALGGAPAAALTKTLLTSVGTDGAAATADNARAAISENGRYVAFQSRATLNVSSFPPPPPTTAPPTTSNPDPAPTAPPTTGPPTAVPTTAAPTTTPPTSPPPVFAPANSPAPSSPAPDVVPAQAAAAVAGNWRIYARDQTGLVTSLLSDPSTGNATAPTISGTGKLVSYLFNDGFENSIVVANRQATGTGAFDTKQNLVIKTVTGTPNDVQFERITDNCPSGIGKGGVAMRTTPCGPKLSAYGSTLVFPAQLSPLSPALSAEDTSFGFNNPFQLPGNLVDFGENSPTQFSDLQITFTNLASQPLNLTGVTATGPFTTGLPFEGGGPACGGTLQPGGKCSVVITFDNVITATNPDGCPTTGTTERTGTLTTDAAVPDGQFQLALVAYCNSAFNGDARPLSGSRHALQPLGCAAPPPGLTDVTAPTPQSSNFENPVVDFGPTVIGSPYKSTLTFTTATIGDTPNDVEFVAPDCGLQLLNPTTPGGDLVPCVPAASARIQTCTADVLVSPVSVGTDVASLILNGDVPQAAQFVQYVSVTGLSDVIIAQRDTSGNGNFAASKSTVVSVDATGTPIQDASQPSVSATGRYVAFAAPATGQVVGSTSVWRHDTDAAGNGTFHPGAATVVSCLPGGGACNAAPDADSPSISGDGSQVAFATIALLQGEVYDRDVTAGSTTLVSAPATGNGNANGFSYAPSMSQDGSTVAYISTATNLEVPATPAGAANLYVRNLLLGAGAPSELATPSGTSLPPKDDIALPDVDALGGLVTFQTSQQLLPAAPPLVTSIYTFEREPALTFSPAPVSFGTLKVGSAGATITVTVTNTGPGPGTVTTAETTEPFGVTIGDCDLKPLHEGESCVLTVSLTPQQAGTDNGTLTSTVTDELGSPGSFSDPITANVIVVKVVENAKIAVNPFVAPAGQVTVVTGHGFTPGQEVTLSWDHGLGQVGPLTVPQNGDIKAVMVIFPDDYTGLRMLEARDLTNKVLATTEFLAQQPTIGPPFNSASVPGLPSPPKLPATPA